MKQDVMTKDRRGNLQVRSFISKGRFAKYNYRDPKTGKILEGGKFSIILNGKEHYYMIPMKGGFLAIPMKEKKKRKMWDWKTKKALKI